MEEAAGGAYLRGIRTPRCVIVVGLDIGGANLKAADGGGRAVERPFALWRRPDELANELRALLAPFPDDGLVAVTMTAELCDCFASKSDGVRHVVRHVSDAVGGRRVRYWTTRGAFASAANVEADPLVAAASNWLALATFAGRFAPRGQGLVLDLGSTTADVVPLVDGRPTPIGRTDPERLASEELVYCGVRRTPLCAVFGLDAAAEWFATTEDVYVCLGDLPESPERTDTADGRPMTRAHALRRLARMRCDDVGDGTTARATADEAKRRQVERLARAVRTVVGRLPGPPKVAVLAGSGAFLWPAALDAAGLGKLRRVSLADRLGPDASTAACAHAVAVLASEEATR